MVCTMDRRMCVTPNDARGAYERMCERGTAAFTPEDWREMGRILSEAARRAPLGMQTPLTDRARDCALRAVRAYYLGSVGAGFRPEAA
jgi:hypothetical protein